MPRIRNESLGSNNLPRTAPAVISELFDILKESEIPMDRSKDYAKT